MAEQLMDPQNLPPSRPILLAYVASIVAPLVICLAAGYFSYGQIKADAELRAMRTAQALSEHALRTFRAHDLIVAAVGKYVDGWSWDAIAQSQGVHEFLAQFVRGTDDINTVFVAGPDGTQVNTSLRFPAGSLNVSDRDFFVGPRQRDELYISAPDVGRLNNQAFFSFTRRRTATDGAFDGIISVSVNPSYFSTFYESVLESPGDVVALVREDGVFLAHTPDTLARSKGKDSGLMQAMAAGADYGIYSGESSVDGRDRMVAYRRVGAYPLYVSYGLSQAAVWTAWRRTMMAYVLVTLLAIGMLLAAAALVRNRHAKEQLAVRRYAEESALRAAAEQSSRAKDEFLAALSHELRNPLSAIANAAELMKRQQGAGEDSVATLGIVSRQVQHLKRLLGDLLDVARTNYGKLQLEKQNVDAMQLARTVVADMQGLGDASEPGSETRISVSGTPVAVAADPARLRQMMENLLENARKYGGKNISLDIRRNGDAAEITVADDGKGIDPELLPRLFEPFAQGHQTIDRAKGGLGLGLALVRRLADLHGGSLAVASKPGRTVFTIRLPLAGSVDMPSAEAARAAPVRRRLMLVEDQQDTRESLAALLTMEGNEVLAVADGNEALRQFAQFRPEVVLIDIGLPQMNGYELARRLRALSPEGVRLIALTGYGQPADKKKSRDVGFAAHLVKPLSLDDLRKWL